ncbi:MAG TPA: hypothetical protein VMQ81_06115, partial [Acidimicrobiia bacterium]|nr:hypothetical protein [Acidimicrobiia bacterium]
MSRVILATPSEEFEAQLRAVYGDTLGGDLRYWRDGLLRGHPSQVVEELAGTGADVVAIGPGIH